MSSAPVEMESPLWRFSLAVYRGAGVQEECLDVQERYGVDVNLLMLCAYAGAVEGAALSARDVEDALDATGGWHADVVRVLRQVRRSLKPWGEAGDFAQVAGPLRLKVKAAELESEQIEQAMMWTWLRERGARLPRRDAGAALAANVRALLVRCGAIGEDADPFKALPQFCAAALATNARPRATGTGS
jgi:uncharacterized protein (TIGR02444 family)